jgi:hypothetical protein
VNAEREQQGLPVVNGLWLEGETGAIRQPLPFDAVRTNDAALAGLARAARVPWLNSPIGTWCDASRNTPADPGSTPTSRMLAIAQDPTGEREGDAMPPQSNLQPNLQSNPEPLPAALRDALGQLDTGALDRLRMVLTGERGGVELELTRGDRWRVWHRLESGHA